MTDRTPDSIAAAPSGPLARLQQARVERWHQNGEALLTFENVRSWLNAAGLVLFAPRPQIAAPAPTFVEAVLGAPTVEPTLKQTEEPRSLLARMIAEGIAVPLNLLGTTAGAVGETPDYVVSAGVFSYVFTLRGDKAWKQPPATSGVTRVSQLAAHTYEILTKSGPRTASDLTSELGNAVTESAVLRALGELWTRLRVLPIPQSDGRPTLWELTSTRFTKQIKAGANAGQPSALSALSSLYLSQVLAATEEEIEIFLSPLAPRSRTRDVLHALTAARELETIAVEGRTMVHVSGQPPAFLNAEAATTEHFAAPPAGGESGGEEAEEAAPAGDRERIKKYIAKPRKPGTGPLAKGVPVKRDDRRAQSGDRKSFARSGERERRPFNRERPEAGASGDKPRFPRRRPEGSPADRPRFDRPWNESRPKPKDRGERTERSGYRAPHEQSEEAPRRRTATPRQDRADRGNGGWNPAFRENKRPLRQEFREETGRSRPERGAGTRGERAEFGGRPRRTQPDSFARPARRDDRPDRPERPRFERRPAGPPRGGRPGADPRNQGDRPARPFRRFDAPRGGENRSPRQSGNAPRNGPGGPGNQGRSSRPFRPRAEGSERGGRPAKFASGGPRRDFAGRPKPRTGEQGRSAAKKGTFRSAPRKRTFRREEDESA